MKKTFKHKRKIINPDTEVSTYDSCGKLVLEIQTVTFRQVDTIHLQAEEAVALAEWILKTFPRD